MSAYSWGPNYTLFAVVDMGIEVVTGGRGGVEMLVDVYRGCSLVVWFKRMWLDAVLRSNVRIWTWFYA